MKVIGTGAPAALTLRLSAGQRDALCDELHHRRAIAIETLSHRSSGDGAAAVLGGVHEEQHERLLAIGAMLDQLEGRTLGDSVEVVGPTWLLGPSIGGATTEAIHRLLTADAVTTAMDSVRSVELLGAAQTALAWVETRLAYEHVDHHGVPDV